MLTVLVDYESGNLHSAQKAFERMSAEVNGGDVIVSSKPEDVLRADRIVLPGDGAFPACRRELDAVTGMGEALHEAVITRARPFMGICVGMQLLASKGHEYSETPGLDWIGGDVVPITPADKSLKVPHMGWNDLVIDQPHPVLDGVKSGDHTYFVHSYRFAVSDPAHLLAHVDYGGAVTALIGRDNLVGAQFHPEKSQDAGLRMIGNFLLWRP